MHRSEQHSLPAVHRSPLGLHDSAVQYAAALSVLASCPGNQYGTCDGSRPAVGIVSTAVTQSCLRCVVFP